MASANDALIAETASSLGGVINRRLALLRRNDTVRAVTRGCLLLAALLCLGIGVERNEGLWIEGDVVDWGLLALTAMFALAWWRL